jgi:pilus assembly protein CpaF
MNTRIVDRRSIFEATLDEYLRPVREYREDPSVSEIMINGPDEVYVECRGKLKLTDCRFDAQDLLALARNLAQFVNFSLNPDTAYFDSRLPDGSRVHVAMPKNSRHGLCLAIRQFARASFSLDGLVAYGTITPEVKEYLELVVVLNQNIIVAGGTGTGKTSFLNALSGVVPATDRVIVIEDISELKLAQPHVLRFEASGPDQRGKGAVSVRDLFRSALRMRPDRIIIGECRGGEALDLIQAMTSGHGGSMSTLHASRPDDALRRLETMALMSGVELNLASVRAQVSSAIQVIVQLSRTDQGARVVSAIAEVGPLTNGLEYSTQDIFTLNPVPGGGKQILQQTGALSGLAALARAQNALHRVVLTKRLFGG